MKAIAFIAVLLLLGSNVQAQTLTAAQDKLHENENSTVCGTVAGERTASSSRGAPTFINLDSPYPKQVFTILVWGNDRKNIGELPSTGSRVCATGLIKDYGGVPEIEVKSKEQLSH